MNFTEEFDSFFAGCLFIFFILILFFLKKKKIEDRFKFSPLFRVVSWNILLTVFLVFSIFIVGESYYRFFVDRTDSYGVSKICKRWIDHYVTFNNAGVRDNITYYRKIQDGKRRLTIIGDSFSNGHGIKDVDKRFGNLIRARYPNVEVHVMAVSGANSYSQLNNLKKLKSEGYEFDVVILAYCLNDIDYFTIGSKKIYERIRAFQNRLGFLAKNSYFINILSFQFFALNDPDFMNYSDFVLEGYLGKAWEQQMEVLKDIKAFVDRENIKFIVVNFPFLQQQIENYTFEQTHLQLWDFWKNQGVNYIDLLNVYEPYLGEQLTVNKYDAHPNEFAHELAFKKLEIFLQKK